MNKGGGFLNDISQGSTSLVLLIIAFLLIGVIIYIFVEYMFFKKNLNHLAPIIQDEYKAFVKSEDLPLYVTNVNPKVISPMSHDTKSELMVLLKGSITSLRDNATTFTKLNFYNQPIEKLLANNTWYKTVLKLSKFCFVTPTVTHESIDTCIEELYGSLQDKNLFAMVNGIEYYIPLEFEPAMYVYLNNKNYLDKILM